MREALMVTDSLVWTAETEYAVAVAAAEASMGARITLVAPAASPVADRVPEGVLFLELPGPRPSASPVDFAADTRFLAALSRGGRFEVVHSSRQTAHLMAALAVGPGTPLVHLRGSAAVPSSWVGNRLLYNRATAAVVVSSSRIEGWVVERLRVPERRVHVLHAPVGESWFEPPVAGEPLAEFGIAPGTPVVLNVARLSPVKGHSHLLEAMAGVAAAAPDAVLLLVGEPWSGQPEGLAREARELGIENAVVFAGRRENVRELVSAAAVCVTSSVGSEENSRAVAEYMAAGRPVVATAVGVIPELLSDRESGSLVPAGDPAAMADAIVATLADSARAARLGARAREVARERFSPASFMEGLTGVLEAVEVSA